MREESGRDDRLVDDVLGDDDAGIAHERDGLAVAVHVGAEISRGLFTEVVLDAGFGEELRILAAGFRNRGDLGALDDPLAGQQVAVLAADEDLARKPGAFQRLDRAAMPSFMQRIAVRLSPYSAIQFSA